jgi:hypothetical protein
MDRRTFIRTSAGLAPAFSTQMISTARGVGPLAADLQFRAGFSSVPIHSCIRSQTAFRRPLEAVCASLASSDKHVILLSLDLIGMSREEWKMLREAVAGGAGIPSSRVWIHTTHTHSAPWGARGDGNQQIVGLDKKLVECAQQAVSAARPASIRAGITDVGKSLSLYRRGDTGADLGLQTFWFGYTYRDNDDRPDASALVNEMRSRWLDRKPDYTPTDEPLWFDGEVDSLVQSIRFEDENSQCIGSMVRFAAHPHLTCSCLPWKYDPDYPGVVRRVIQQHSNFPVMFLTGACGNLVPKEKVKYKVDESRIQPFPHLGPSSAFYPENEQELLDEMDRIGTAVAGSALAGLKQALTEKVAFFGVASAEYDVTLDTALPASRQEIETIRKALAAEAMALRCGNHPLRELRGIANRLNWLDWAGSASLDLISDEERASAVIKMPLAAMIIDRHVFLFLHSEIVAETTFELRKALPQFDLWTMGLTNGDLGYFPTARMIDESGYEGRSTLIAGNAEEKLRNDILDLLKKTDLGLKTR